MIIFYYKALNNEGKVLEGTLEAPDRKQAMVQLAAQGLKPISLKTEAESKTNTPSGTKPSTATGGSVPNKANDKLVLSFFKKLYQLHSGGMTLGDSIRLMSQRLANPAERDLAAYLWKELSQGRSLANAMSQMPELFNRYLVSLLEAGEATGHVAPVIQNVIGHLEEKREIRQKLLGGLTYPLFICLMGLGVIIFFLFFLLPKIQGMIKSLGGEINFITQVLIYSAQFLVKVGPFLLGAVLVGGLTLVSSYRTAKGRAALDKWILSVPLLGPISLYAELYQISNLMATLMESGINTTESLRLTERTFRNTYLQERFRLARQQINEGVSFSAAFRNQSLMPLMALDILSIGENTGKIQKSLFELNHMFKEELSLNLKRLTVGLSSGALAVAFLFTGLIAVGMVSSIFQVSQNIRF